MKQLEFHVYIDSTLETIPSQSVWFPNIVVELEFWLGSGFEPAQIFHFLRIIEKFEFCSNLLETLRIYLVRIRIYSNHSFPWNREIRILRFIQIYLKLFESISFSDSSLFKSFTFFEQFEEFEFYLVQIRFYSKFSLSSNREIRILSRSDSILLKSVASRGYEEFEFCFIHIRFSRISRFEGIRRIRILFRSHSNLSLRSRGIDR